MDRLVGRTAAPAPVMVVHRPHPAPEAGRATVRDMVAFLEAVGVKP